MSPLASGIALALGASAVSPVAAQTSDEEGVLEEVVVTGVRGSFLESASIKRDSDGVVDAIVAEDIGKFPDTNLAESLQRITGVSIDRSNAGASLGAEGEGQRVTVRGIGADFNLVLLNGRSMPTSGLFPTGTTNGRSFDFSNLASEGVRAVEVYKTSMANIPSGGLGATINVVTARPLDLGDRQMSFGAKAVHDESDQDSAWTPEFSGIYSDVFADGTFGVTVAAIYQEREFGYNQAGVFNDWVPSNFRAGWADLPPPGTPGFENLPEPGAPSWLPQSLGYAVADVDRERLNGQLALQWRPIDSLTLTLDYTYAETEVQQRTSDLSFWFIQVPSGGVFRDAPVSPLVYTENAANRDWSTGTADAGWKTELDSIGFNADWVVNDGLGFALDFHSSESESGAASPFGSASAMGIPAFYDIEVTADFSNDLPVISTPTISGLTPADHEYSGAAFRNAYSRMEIEQLDLSGYFDINDRQTLDFGVLLSETNNRTAYGEVQYADWGGPWSPEDVPDDVFPAPTCLPCNFDNIPGSGDPAFFPEMFIYDFPTMAALREQVTGQTSRAPDNFTNDLRTKEETTAAYLQWLLNFDIGNMNSNLRVGMRYETTDVTSSSLTPVPLRIEWASANEYFIIFSDQQDFTTSEGDYDNWLPNIDWNVSIRDDLIVRASYSQTIGRQAWDDIQGGQTLDALVRQVAGTGSTGNPSLKPLESKNYDLSFEWYYGEGSYASVGYFRKDVENYVAIASRSSTPFDLPHPGNGPWYDECNAATGGGNDQPAIRECIFERYGDSEYVDVEAATIQGVPGQDPAAVFNLSTPTAQNDVEIDGWEFAFQHIFGDTGFGFSANYTMVDSDVAYDNLSFDDQFAILGLSDSANIVGFYDKNGWIARLAWNWRDEFLANTNPGGIGQPNPTYTEEYQQLDGIVSYEFENGITLFAEAFNLTDEYSRAVGRNSDMARYVTQTGRRYGIGVRWTY